MPLMEAEETRIERISGDRVKNSTPPERTWLSMSVSVPSWLDGNTLISSWPPVASLMRAAASMLRALSGGVAGRLVPSL